MFTCHHISFRYAWKSIFDCNLWNRYFSSSLHFFYPSVGCFRRQRGHLKWSHDSHVCDFRCTLLGASIEISQNKYLRKHVVIIKKISTERKTIVQVAMNTWNMKYCNKVRQWSFVYPRLRGPGPGSVWRLSRGADPSQVTTLWYLASSRESSHRDQQCSACVFKL